MCAIGSTFQCVPITRIPSLRNHLFLLPAVVFSALSSRGSRQCNMYHGFDVGGSLFQCALTTRIPSTTILTREARAHAAVSVRSDRANPLKRFSKGTQRMLRFNALSSREFRQPVFPMSILDIRRFQCALVTRIPSTWSPTMAGYTVEFQCASSREVPQPHSSQPQSGRTCVFQCALITLLKNLIASQTETRFAANMQ